MMKLSNTPTRCDIAQVTALAVARRLVEQVTEILRSTKFCWKMWMVE